MILTWQEILLKNPSWAWLSPCPRMPLMTKPGFLSQSEGSHFSDVLLKAGKWNWLNHVWLFVTPWTVSHQAPQAMEFSRPEYWSGLPFPPPGDLPEPRTEPSPPTLKADSLPFEPRGKPIKSRGWQQTEAGVSARLRGHKQPQFWEFW